MATYVAIANLAASLIGEDDQLRAPDDDTHLGRSIAAVWDLQRQDALRDHPWNFAVKRVGLPASNVQPIGWRYSYPLPPDYLRLIELIGFSNRSGYQLEGGAILSNRAAPLKIRYIADIEEPAFFDALFTTAFAARLAWAIADRITGDTRRKDQAWNAYQAELAKAKRADALENPAPREELSPWERAHIASGDDGWPRSYVPGEGPQIIT